MANNRMYLRCKACGCGVLLAKSHGAGYATPSYSVGFEAQLDERVDGFFNKHDDCENNLEGEGYELAYESAMTDHDFEVASQLAEHGNSPEK